MSDTLETLFEAPAAVSRALRVLVYGPTKSGKSHFIHTATQIGPLYWQDTERGSDFYPPDHGFGFRVLYSKDPMKTIEAVAAANALAAQGGPTPTVATDSASSIWFQQQEVAESLSDKWSGGRAKQTSFRAWGPAKKPLKRLYEMLHASICHVIISARAKIWYEVVNNEPIERGLKPDIEKGLPFAVDVILEMGVKEVKSGPPKANDYFAKVVGTRSASVDGSQPPIHIGRVFYNPKFSDLLVASLEGHAPSEVEGTVVRQAAGAAGAPVNWAQLVTKLPDNWDEARASAALGEVFGEYNPADILLYYLYIIGKAEDEKDGVDGTSPSGQEESTE